MQEKPGSGVESDLAFLSGLKINFVKKTEEEYAGIRDAFYKGLGSGNSSTANRLSLTDKLYSTAERGAHNQNQSANEKQRQTTNDKRQTNNAFEKLSLTGSVIQQVDSLIRRAIRTGASDIHLEPYETLFRVRYRLDGVLYDVAQISLLQKSAVISRLKVMASLDIAEKRRPQDGRIRLKDADATVDIRVSTLPTDFGEKIVLRILDKRNLNLDLSGLGLEEEKLALVRKTFSLPHGMILVTGPTGSGKTTTLYAGLNEINTPHINITTIEDPIEYNLLGINQTHIRADIGFTFASALRAFLRQDPNVIMVGEIRDGETASIAIRAALTGHLVLSTLHTNDAPSSISRLLNMDVEPYLVASSVRLVIAQRLVRRVCLHCKEERSIESDIAKELGLEKENTSWKGVGCEHCNGTGYAGRIAIFEFMPMSDRLSEAVTKRVNAREFRSIALSEGMSTLREQALKLMRKGLTSVEEVVRETSE